MIRATLVEEEVSYKTDTINEIANKLYEYINECYGKHFVLNIHNERLINCTYITRTGEYFIHTTNKVIHCFIDCAS